ncbi:cytochrome b/b6 domain-containing protein [Thiothrix eikelboomii]|uniref:cytochrome b/b6 domain-containing protein n=1 Tax=Thiothrix eikelboomii TaxID=92487 RepID=UPI003BB1E140
MSERILVWDWPTRVFHWSFALSFAGAYLTAESERYRDLHLALGYVFGVLILFRLIWGVIGTRYARFSSFSFAPTAVLSYLKSLSQGQAQHFLGHNPAGAIAIFLLLGLGLLISLTGIALAWELGAEDWEELYEETHEWVANFMLLVVFVHIAGVLVSSWLHHENLARAMITGYKQGQASAAIQGRFLWLGVLILIGILVFLVMYLS